MSWPEVEIKLVARVVGGATPKSDEAKFWDGDVAWATPKDLSDLDGKFMSDTPRKITSVGLRSCSAEVLPAGSVLFSSRAPIGHIAINTAPMATNQGFKSFIPGPDLDATFLYWWLDANRARLQAMGNGATFKEVSKAIVERIKIPLPPLPEQRRIAAILDQADALRRKRAEALTRLSALGQAIFYEHQLALNVDSQPLQNFCYRITDGTHQSPKWSESGIPFIFVSNVRNQRVSLQTQKFISDETYQELTRNCPVDDGDVLYTCVGSYGHAALAPTSEKFLFQRHIAHLKPHKSKLLPEYLLYLLESPTVRRQADAMATGIAQKTVTLSSIKKFLVRIPSIDQQTGVVEKMRQLQATRRQTERSISSQNALFAAIQQRAFRGEL